MGHIPADTLEQIKQKLLAQKEKLAVIRKDVDEENPANNDKRLTDNSTDADALEEVQIFESEVVGSQVDDTLARVEAALAHIEDGSYGHTADGQEIPVERLLADPTATTLVS